MPRTAHIVASNRHIQPSLIADGGGLTQKPTKAANPAQRSAMRTLRSVAREENWMFFIARKPPPIQPTPVDQAGVVFCDDSFSSAAICGPARVTLLSSSNQTTTRLPCGLVLA